jgi:hypothetical protein
VKKRAYYFKLKKQGGSIMKQNMHLFRKFIVVIALIISFTTPSFAVELDQDHYSIIDAINTLGVNIPEEILILEERDLILTELNDNAKQGRLGVYNYQPIQELYNRLLIAHGGTKELSSSNSFRQRYTLADSTQYGSWSNAFRNYNCYAFGLHKTYWLHPGDLSGGGFSQGLSISQMANLVIRDLEEIGFTAFKTTTKPSSFGGANIILSIRKGSSDFHVMRADRYTSLWRHKPSWTQPLTWNYSSPGYKTWTNEHIIYGIAYPSSTTYTSTIYYIVGFLQVKSLEE